jgi:M3 family oligoendopeptidase
MSFVHFPTRPAHLNAEFAESEYAKLKARVASAEESDTPELWLALYADWNSLDSYVSSEGSRRRYRYSKHMDDAEAEADEQAYRETIVPVSEGANSELIAALLASRHKEALGERYGKQLLRVLEVEVEPLAPVNSELRVKAGDLAKQYDKRVAAAEVVVAGESLTLARARGLLSSSDPAIRREAYQAYRGWFDGEREALATIFSDLVETRDQMGRNLGHPNFVSLGYAGMGRTDYGPAEVKSFRDAVEKHASPLYAKFCARQAKALGTSTLRPWDRTFRPELTLPTGVAKPIDTQLDKAGRVFQNLSPQLAAHFQRMRDEGLIDLENRKGKRAGAFCTAFSDEPRVAIFCNSIGDEGDVKTLMHEMGHAFQGWESQWIDAVALRWPTSDAAEVHSMGMEFLSLPQLGEFFTPEQLARFTKSRWHRAIELLCYVSVVDAFQHWVYENPTATPEERDAAWIRLQDTYMPGIDWSGEGEALRRTRWYMQLHVFRYPFYYIDYAIAESGAMQLGMLDALDHERCLATYLELCRLGGTGSVLELFEGAGLRSPFEPALIEDLARHAASVVGLES